MEKKIGAIIFFDPEGKNGEFSNVYPCIIEIDGRSYASVENYYQSEKASSEKLRKWIADAPDGEEAKIRAHRLKPSEIVGDWDTRKFVVMRKGLFAKYTQNLGLRDRLLATDDRELHERNPDDLVWAMQGQDLIGKFLVELRSAIRSGDPWSFLRRHSD